MGKRTAIAVLAAGLIASGCFGLPTTRWVCKTGDCIPKERASNKCLAQANAAFSRNKHTIWNQCMRGEGFDTEVCSQQEAAYDSDCQVLHVW